MAWLFAKIGPFTDNVTPPALSAATVNAWETGLVNAQAPPCARVNHNTTQSIAHNAETTLAFNAERYDVDGLGTSTIHDNSTNNSRLTARVAGKYLITAQAEWANTVTAAYILIRLNGTTVIAKSYVGSNYFVVDVTTQYSLAVSDYVEARVLQTNGGATALNVVSTSAYTPEFMMVRVA